MHMAENLRICGVKPSTFFMHMAVRTSNYVKSSAYFMHMAENLKLCTVNSSVFFIGTAV